MKKTKIEQKTPEILEVQAQKYVEQQKYRDAIDSYKRLLKIEVREEWKQQLAQMYLLRSLEIGKKELYQEAVVFWENYHNTAHQIEHAQLYLLWLFKVKQFSKIVKFLNNYQQALDTTVLHLIDSYLASALLAGEDILKALLDNNSLIIQHYPFAKSALQAYCKKDIQGVDAALKKIPFRSPYKDFRIILKALQLLEVNREEGLNALNTISEKSPYFVFAQSCLLQGLDDEQKLLKLGNLKKFQQLFVQKLTGFNKRQTQLLSSAQNILKQCSDKKALEFVIKNFGLFGRKNSYDFCVSLLHDYPAGKKIVQRTLGLSVFDGIRIKALAYENQDDISEAVSCWYDCIEILKEEAVTKTSKLKTALLMRHTAKLINVSDYDSAIYLLEDSLDLDPEDKESYLALMGLLCKYKDEKEAFQWIDKALKQYPEDIELLMIAMQINIKKKAFKKAAGFAKNVLKLDPINLQAKIALVSCHVAHARKLIKADKYELAEKELSLAEQAIKGKNDDGFVHFLQALLAFKQNDKASCKQLIQQAFQKGKGLLCGYFRLHIEILQLGLPVASILRLSPPLVKNYEATSEEIIALMSYVISYQQRGIPFVDKVIDKLKANIKQSLISERQNFSVANLTYLCQTFEEIEHFELLRFVVKLALELHPEEGMFIYYHVFAKINGDIDKMSYREKLLLEEVLEKIEQRDDRSRNKIIKLLQAYDMNHYRNDFEDMDFFVNDNDDDVDYDELDDEDRAKISRLMNELNKLNQLDEVGFLQFMFDGKQPTPQQIIQLERGGEKGFQKMIIDKLIAKAGLSKEDSKRLEVDKILANLF